MVGSACSLPLATGDQIPGPAGAVVPRVAEPDPSRPRYDRDEWQPRGWADFDGDGCNTRSEVLDAESTAATTTTGRCKVSSGEWLDPYTSRTIRSPDDLQIDHLVALADAHRSGGWAWPPEKKVAFTNALDDPEHLNAVWGPENQRKADDGPDQWLPPNPAYRCAYVAAYARIKVRWDLTVTPAQALAITTWTSACRPAAGNTSNTAGPPAVPLPAAVRG